MKTKTNKTTAPPNPDFLIWNSDIMNIYENLERFSDVFKENDRTE